MPITLTQLKNPWAAQAGALPAMEVQRSDLFTVDFSSAYDAIRTVFERSRDADGVEDLLRQFPSRDELPYYARAVDFGDSRIGQQLGRRHEVPVPYPGEETPYGQVTVTLMQDATGESSLYASKIMAFFRGWRVLARAGRAGVNQREVSLDLLQASADGRSLIPHFRHNFVVRLWKGATPAPGAEPDPLRMELATQWTVQGAWVESLQPAGLASDQGVAHGLRVIFAAEAMVEGLGGSVRILPIVQVG